MVTRYGRRPRRRGALRAALLALILGSLTPAPAAHGQTTWVDEVYAESWARGPARWLMLAAEQRQTRRLSSAADWASFIDEFWRRRDPTPEDAHNPAREAFHRRVREADALFSDRERGSLTPRGRAYLLLGPPAYMSQQYQVAPSWNPQMARGEAPAATRIVQVEQWRWRPEDLTPALRTQLTRKKWKLELETRFAITPEGCKLLAGDDLLRLATRSLVLRGSNSARAQDGS